MHPALRDPGALHQPVGSVPARFQQRGLVQHRHPPRIQQDLTAHDDGVDVRPAGVVGHRSGRTVHRLAAHGVQIDEGDVGRRAGRQPPALGARSVRPTAAPRPSSSSGSHPPRPSRGRRPRRAWPTRRRSWRTPADPGRCSRLSRRCPAPRRSPGRASSAPAPRRRPGTGCWSGSGRRSRPPQRSGRARRRSHAPRAQAACPAPDSPGPPATRCAAGRSARSSRSISSCVSATWICVGRFHERASAVISRIASSQQRHGASGPDATRMRSWFLPCQVSWSQANSARMLSSGSPLARGPPSRGQAPSAGPQSGRRWRLRRQSHGPAACDAARRW